LQGLARAAGKPILLVFSAERIARHPNTLLQTVARIQDEPYSADVCSLEDGRDLDTTDPTGELLLFLKGWFGRMWLKLMRAGTVEGLKRARAAGKQIGRPPEITADQAAEVRRLRAAGHSWRETAGAAGCTVSAARRVVERGAPEHVIAPDGDGCSTGSMSEPTVSGTAGHRLGASSLVP
jgi:putative DNA-invertase from lambdoid prophage Rac